MHSNEIATTGDTRSSLLTLIDDFAKANPTVIGTNQGDQNAPAIIRGLLPLLDPKMYYQLYGVDF